MTGRTVDNWAISHILSVMNHDGPNVDEGKQCHIRQFLQREDEGEHMVGDALSKAVEGVESMACKRCRHDPFVVWLVKRLVHSGVMQAAMDPVNEAIGEEEEEGKLEIVV